MNTYHLTHRYTKIICTIGPASLKEAMLIKMVKRGMNVARINSSHGNHKQHQQIIDVVRAVNQKIGSNITILQDLEGYRLRIGKLKKNIVLSKNKVVHLTTDLQDTDDHIPLDFPDDLKSVANGSLVFIDDGKLVLKVQNASAKKLKLKVIQGGVLKERKGVNIPSLKLQANILTEKDVKDMEFGVANGVDFIAQSFVRNKKDILRVEEIARAGNPKCKVIAKIENEEGLKNLEGIIEACDGVMVARGDLGVTMPIYKIPMIQKYIIRHCNYNKKLSITATQMLDSMIEEGRPTRAEVSDVANAILDGTDFVMLSGETAVGRYPSRCVMMMSQIIEYTEKYANLRPQ